MNDYVLQKLRYLLQKRFRLVKSSPHHRYRANLKRFWNYLINDSSFSPIISNTLNDEDYKKKFNSWFENNGMYENNTFEDQAKFAIHFLNHIINNGDDWNKLNSKFEIYKHDDLTNHITEEFVTAVYEYLDESLDDNIAVISVLLRYKQKVEAFKKNVINQKIHDYLDNSKDKSKRVEEKVLMPNLYEYLHDQGLDIHKEVQTNTGRVDFINESNSLHPFASDGKIFDNSKKNLKYVMTGINQVISYCNDLSRNIGYLVIFNISGKHVELTGVINDTAFPYISKDGKLIFIVIINIDQGKVSASKLSEKSIVKLDIL